MSDYIVTFRVVGEQITRVENCKTKREAILRAIYQDRADPINFTVLHILPTTAEAKEEKSQ